MIQEILDRMARLGLVLYPYRVYVKSLGDRERADPTGFEDHLFRELTRADSPAMFDVLLRDVPLEHLEERFERGDIGYGVFHRGALVAYTCVSRDVCLGAKGSVLFALQPNEMYGYDTCVRRTYRRSGVHSFMMQNCFSVLREMGVEKHYGTVPYFNRVARRAAEKMGYSEIDRRVLVRFFGRPLLRPSASSAVRFFGRPLLRPYGKQPANQSQQDASHLT